MSFIADYVGDLTLAHDHFAIGLMDNRILMREADQSFLLQAEDFFSRTLLPYQSLYIGRWLGRPCFALLFDSQIQRHIEQSDLVLLGLRGCLGVVPDALFALAGRALQLAHWYEYHQFCGRCGSPTELQLNERVLACSRCAALFYPRISPCVIGIVIRGNTCLLAHNSHHREGLFSVLAGFIEVGETAEDAMRREIFEETSITVGELEYIASQSWPFPSQLMLGFIAYYQGGEILVDGKEIIEADWFTADNLPSIPSIHTISGKLIDLFVQRSRRQE